MRFRTTFAGAALVLLALPAAALAHVTVTPTSGPADGFAMLNFTVPHGCDGSSTTRLRVQIPESVPLATPQVHPGWSLETRQGPKDEVELFGETVTEGVSEVIWTAEDAPLPDEYLDVFGVEVKLPANEGETLYFPAIQECERGETRWIQIPAEGETEEDLEEPAPAVTLTTAEEEGAEASQSEASESESDDDDTAPMGLAIAGLVVGGLGLLTGGVALGRARRNGSQSN